MTDALHALYAGDVVEARELLPQDDELSVFEAAAFGRLERLTSILTADPSQATAFSEDGFTALHLAVFGEEEEAARLPIDNGADVNARSMGPIARVPPLGTAAFVRSVPLATLLLDAGANVDGQGEGGFTALHAASAYGDEELIRLLLERGADRTLCTADGKSPDDLAASDAVRIQHNALEPH